MESENNIVLESTEVNPFGMKDKVGYMLGDFANNLLFCLILNYLLVFYTDVFGISAAAVGTLMAVSRVWDAINDPIMGVIADKRKPSKNGKFRPYLKYMGIPLGIITILTFLPMTNMPQGMKLPYAYITYIGFGMAYTAINIPYGSLASVITNKPLERTQLSSWRSIGFQLANILLMILAPKLIFNDSGTVSVKGFFIASVLFAIIGNIAYRFCYLMTTERVTFEVKEDVQKTSLVESLKTLAKNRALIGLILSTLGILLAMSLPNALNAYLFKDYFKLPSLLGLAGMLPMIIPFIILPFSSKLVSKFGKKNLVIYGSLISIVSYLILLFFPTKNPILYLVMSTISGLGTGIFNMIIWALLSDVIDYQEYLSGQREDGTVYATYSFCRKLVQAIVGSIGGFALAAIGYQSGAATQTPQVGESIRILITIIPLIGLILGVLSLKFVYNLNNKKINEVNEELERRRKA